MSLLFGILIVEREDGDPFLKLFTDILHRNDEAVDQLLWKPSFNSKLPQLDYTNDVRIKIFNKTAWYSKHRHHFWP